VTPVQAETLLLTKCSRCHNLDRAFNRRRTEHEWKILVKRMSVRHRSWINDDEAQFIGDYLTKVFGVKEEVRPAVAAAVRLVTPQPPKAIDFTALFQKNGCVFCHGEDGAGQAAGTPGWTDPNWQQSRTDEQLTATITNGKDNQMPKFGGTLTAEEIRAAVKFVRSLAPTE